MIIFDLDLTVWECFNKDGEKIWAKQLLPPFNLKKGVIYDDVFSKCILKKGIFEYIKWLSKKGNIICYCSIGAYKSLPLSYQPSIILLKKFKLYDFFNGPSILEYKSYNKIKFLEKIKEKSIFYDDNDKILNDASSLKHIDVFDAKKIHNWSSLIIH